MQTYLFFLDKLSALILEIIMIILSIIGIMLTLYGLSNIPFYIDKIIFLKIFTLNVLIFSLIMLISLIFIILRKLLLINTLLNKCCYYVSLLLISISILGFMAYVIIGIFIINNMYFYDKKAKKQNMTTLASKEWRNTILVILFLFCSYFIIIFSALSDNLRINLKIDDSYYQYQLAIEEEIKSQINSKRELKYNDKMNNKLNEKIEKKEKVEITDEQIIDTSNELDKNPGKNEKK